MITGGNTANRIDRDRVARAIRKAGGCDCCPPHRWENERRSHIRWADGKPHRRKDKAVK